MPRKAALIIGNSAYQDPALAQLQAPDADVRALTEILGHPDLGQFDEVAPLINASEAKTRLAIATFFARAHPDDMLLLYFSGHGVLDDKGRLYLAATDTQRDLPQATAISAAFVTDAMDGSRSRRQVLILDCCHSGAFARGARSPSEAKAITAATFEGAGYGRAVLTATDATQYAWEGEAIMGSAENSVFTHCMLEGLKTGAADTNQDGEITLEELYTYIYGEVVKRTPKQTPRKWSYNQEGEFVIARNPHPLTPPTTPLPDDLQHSVDDLRPWVRQGALLELERLLFGGVPGLAAAAYLTLQKFKDDDSRRISVTAANLLARYDTQRQAEDAARQAAQRERQARAEREKQAQAEQAALAEQQRFEREQKALAEQAEREQQAKAALAEQQRAEREEKAQAEQAERDRLAQAALAEQQRVEREQKAEAEQAERDKLAQAALAEQQRVEREQNEQAEQAERDKLAQAALAEQTERDRLAQAALAEQQRLEREQAEQAEREKQAQATLAEQQRLEREQKEQAEQAALAERERLEREQQVIADREKKIQARLAERRRLEQAQAARAERDRLAQAASASAPPPRGDSTQPLPAVHLPTTPPPPAPTPAPATPTPAAAGWLGQWLAAPWFLVVALGLGWAVSRGLAQALFPNDSYPDRLPWLLNWLLGGAAGGYLTGLVLRRLEPNWQSRHTRLVTTGWAAAWLLAFIWIQAVNQYLSYLDWGELYTAASVLFTGAAGAVGGYWLGRAWRAARPGLAADTVAPLTGGWALAWGLATVVIHLIESNSGWVVAWIWGGLAGGLAGGAVTLAVAGRVRAQPLAPPTPRSAAIRPQLARRQWVGPLALMALGWGLGWLIGSAFDWLKVEVLANYVPELHDVLDLVGVALLAVSGGAFTLLALRRLAPALDGPQSVRLLGLWIAAAGLSVMVALVVYGMVSELDLNVPDLLVGVLSPVITAGLGAYALARQWQHLHPDLPDSGVWRVAGAWAAAFGFAYLLFEGFVIPTFGLGPLGWALAGGLAGLLAGAATLAVFTRPAHQPAP